MRRSNIRPLSSRRSSSPSLLASNWANARSLHCLWYSQSHAGFRGVDWQLPSVLLAWPGRAVVTATGAKVLEGRAELTKCGPVLQTSWTITVGEPKACANCQPRRSVCTAVERVMGRWNDDGEDGLDTILERALLQEYELSEAVLDIFLSDQSRAECSARPRCRAVLLATMLSSTDACISCAFST